jgi:hypothetical protein
VTEPTDRVPADDELATLVEVAVDPAPETVAVEVAPAADTDDDDTDDDEHKGDKR